MAHVYPLQLATLQIIFPAGDLQFVTRFYQVDLRLQQWYHIKLILNKSDELGTEIGSVFLVYYATRVAFRCVNST
jgi:hypothetical protein